MRGSPGECREHARRRGSIPACAGEPRTGSSRRRSVRVYPRVCGGASGGRSGVHACAGLSPRVRGSHSRAPRLGSIPACAGEPSASSLALLARVYPRVCGGAFSASSLTILIRGLSPRVRGSPRLAASGACLKAGLSPRVRGSLRRARCSVIDLAERVYPRVCGGGARWSSSNEGSIPACAGEPRERAGPARGGLSPRVRGSPLAMERVVDGTGLSPRVRGSQEPARRPRRPARGLSPRVRGSRHLHRPRVSTRRVYPRVCGGATHWPLCRCGCIRGSIPACAGEPHVGGLRKVYPRMRPRGAMGQTRVYPRVCGGAPVIVACPVSLWRPGSIPACAGEPRHQTAPGSIPACAGEPLFDDQRTLDGVYPRVCGGAREPHVGHAGSIPACAEPGLWPRVCGSIPACAGEPAVRPTRLRN